MTFFERPTRLIGSRGSRRSAGVRYVPPPPPDPPVVSEDFEPFPPPVPRADSLISRVLTFLGRRHATPAPVRVPRPVQPRPSPPAEVPVTESSLDRGLRDIRRTDPGFDPSRIAGYVGMIFRTTQHAWMRGDIGPLRDRVTPELYGEMQAQCDRLRRAGHVNRVAEIEITATVTEAWQERGFDYVTAHISGSIIDYTVEEARGSVVDGARDIPREVEEFWTFTRPAGLNFWMLAAIQT